MQMADDYPLTITALDKLQNGQTVISQKIFFSIENKDSPLT